MHTRIHRLAAVDAQRVDAAHAFRDAGQVVDALIQNAVDAAGGDICIIISFHALDGSVGVTVADDGTGIHADDAQHIFEEATKGTHQRRAGATSRVADISSASTTSHRGRSLAALARVCASVAVESTHQPVDDRDTGVTWCFVDARFPSPGKRVFTSLHDAVSRGVVQRPRSTRGTTVRARGIFHNLPARTGNMTPAQVRSLILGVITLHAVQRPGVAFSLSEEVHSLSGGREAHLLLRLPATPSTPMRLQQLYGLQYGGMRPVSITASDGSLRLAGYMTPHAAAGARVQFLFVNGKDARLQAELLSTVASALWRHSLQGHSPTDGRTDTRTLQRARFAHAASTRTRALASGSSDQLALRDAAPVSFLIHIVTAPGALSAAAASSTSDNDALIKELKHVLVAAIAADGDVMTVEPVELRHESKAATLSEPTPTMPRLPLVPASTPAAGVVPSGFDVIDAELGLATTAALLPSRRLKRVRTVPLTLSSTSDARQELHFDDAAAVSGLSVTAAAATRSRYFPATPGEPTDKSHTSIFGRSSGATPFTSSARSVQAALANSVPRAGISAIRAWVPSYALYMRHTAALIAQERARVIAREVQGRVAGSCRELHDCDTTAPATAYPSETAVSRLRLQQLRVVGQADAKFIVATAAGGGTHHRLVLIDQHAADERIRLERLEDTLFPRAAAGASDDIAWTFGRDGLLHIAGVARPDATSALQEHLTSKPLKSPLAVAVSMQTWLSIRARLASLRAWGFDVSLQLCPALDEHGAQEIILNGLPRLFDIDLTIDDLWELVDLMSSDSGNRSDRSCVCDASRGECTCAAPCPNPTGAVELYHRGLLPRVITRILHSKACRGAIMFGDVLTTESCQALLRQLSECRFPFQCAHGRPSLIPLLTIV